MFVADYNGELPQFDGPDGQRGAGGGAIPRMGRGARAAGARAARAPAVAARRLAACRRGAPSGALAIELGRDEPAARLARFVAAYERTIGALARAGTRIEHVDLRYRNGFAARVPRIPRNARAQARPRNEARTQSRDGDSMVKEAKNVIVGLDIGTSKIVAIVAEVAPDGGLNIIGLGTQPSRGLKKGVVVNIEATMASIQRVLEEAELMADCQITEVYTGIAGSHIRSLNSQRHGRDQGEGSHAGRHRPRRRDGEGDRDSQRPADPAHPAAGIHHRRPGGRARAAGHERRAPRGQGAHRHRRGVGGREHHQVRPPLRARRART